MNNKNGWDADAEVGYDWGWLRTELEFGHQQWKPDSIAISVPATAGSAGALVAGSYGNPRGKSTVNTVMANALLDFGGNGGVGFYAGVGAGRAWMSEHLSTGGAPDFLHDKDSAWAWQGVAGLRVPVGEHVELGVKYKYLNTHLFRMVNAFGRNSRFDAQSHTLMASLLFNFGGAAPPSAAASAAPSAAASATSSAASAADQDLPGRLDGGHQCGLPGAAAAGGCPAGRTWLTIGRCHRSGFNPDPQRGRRSNPPAFFVRARSGAAGAIASAAVSAPAMQRTAWPFGNT